MTAWQVLLLMVCAAASGFVFAGLLHRCPRARGIPIKLRHRHDVALFSVGQLLSIDDTLVLTCLGAPMAGGTFEGQLVVTSLDWPSGSIRVRGLR